jgi:hypothetical protein
MVKMEMMVGSATEDGLDIATADDVRAGVDRALRDLDMTITELRSEARAGRFRSERARLVWAAIRDVASEQ